MPPLIPTLGELYVPLYWAKQKVQRVDNRAFDISQTPYIVDIFNDKAQEMVARKASQIRLSMTVIMRFLQRVATKNWNGIYYFPTDSAMRTFVQGRIDPLVERNPELAKLVTKSDNMSIKQIGDAFAFFFGLQGKTQKESTPADCEVFDEYDLMAPGDVDIALQRMQDSPHKCVDRLGNPTLPNYGIDAEFQKSDQKYWTMKCPHCGRRNIAKLDSDEMPFPQCIEQGFLACRKCRKKLDVLVGSWVPEFSKRPVSGYALSRLININADFARIMADYRKGTGRMNLFNRILGIPYADIQSRVTFDQIMALARGGGMASHSQTECTAGVDVGQDYLWVVISRPAAHVLREYVFVGMIEGDDMALWSRLKDLFVKFSVDRYAIDLEPETQPVRDFIRSTYRKEGWAVDYLNTKEPFKFDDNTRTLKVGRTESLDNSHKLLRDALVEFPARCPGVEEFARHCANLQRKQEIDPEDGRITYTWVHNPSDPDHGRHAFNYDALLWYNGEGFEPEGILKDAEDLDDNSVIRSERY